jgi:hypothetical protein
METSHLINAIAHHTNQRNTLYPYISRPNIRLRHEILGKVISTLMNELEQREPLLEKYITKGAVTPTAKQPAAKQPAAKQGEK